jgi:hypothetical protein
MNSAWTGWSALQTGALLTLLGDSVAPKVLRPFKPMVRTTRVLTQKEYWDANSLALQTGTAKQRRNFAITITYGPFIGLVFVALAAAIAYATQSIDNIGTVFLLVLGLYYALQRWLLRRKARKFFASQQLDLPWVVEAADDGVRCELPGLSDTKLSWKYFTTFAETETLFLVINAKRMSFISVPKTNLSADSLEELRLMARRNLPAAINLELS